MSKEMNYAFQHKGNRFNIRVELYALSERHMGGKTFHAITINEIGGSNWRHETRSESANLIVTIQQLKHLAETFSDKVNLKTNDEQLLWDLGFN